MINSHVLYQLSYMGSKPLKPLFSLPSTLLKDFEFGSPVWIRTRDVMINSHLLYQLSYKGMKLFLVLPSTLSKGFKLVQ